MKEDVPQPSVYKFGKLLRSGDPKAAAFVIGALEAHNNCITHAAEAVGVSRLTFHRWCQYLGKR